MRIYIVLYHHRHGYGAFFKAAESEAEAVESSRESLVAMYGEEEVAEEAREYGRLESLLNIVDGEVFEYDGSCYRVHFERLKDSGTE